MGRRILLWTAFFLVHIVVALSGIFYITGPATWDVVALYDPWSAYALSGNGIMGVDWPWVYPQLALLPMMIAQPLALFVSYEVAWAIVVTVGDALVFWMLSGTARSRARVWASAAWLALVLVLGPVGMYRLDAITVPLTVAGCLWLVRRPALASALWTVATWIKVWPAALLLAGVFAVRRRAAVIASAIGVTIVVAGSTLALGAGVNLFGFLSAQVGRGLQIEAPAASWFMLRAAMGDDRVQIGYDTDILTFQVTGLGIDQVISLITPLQIAVLGVIALCGAAAVARGARFAALFPALSWALVLSLLVFNKVGSPQFHTWLIAPMVIGLVLQRRRWIAFSATAVFSAGLTQLVYPLTYGMLTAADLGAVMILVTRNVVLVVLLAWAVWRVIRAAVGSDSASRAASERASGTGSDTGSDETPGGIESIR